MSIGLAVEAFRRLWVIFAAPDEVQAVDGKLMASIAFIGVMVNVVLAFVLGEDHVHMPGLDVRQTFFPYHQCQYLHVSDLIFLF